MRLEFETGALAGRAYRLEAGRMLVGRAEDCDLVVPDASVSSAHAEIEVAHDGSATVHDRGSRNGTFVNGRRVVGSESLRDSGTLAFGPVVARVRLEGDARRSPEMTAALPAVAARPSRSDGARKRSIAALVAAALAFTTVGAVAALLATGALGGDDEDPRPDAIAQRDDESAEADIATPTPTATPTPFTRRDAIAHGRRATVLVSVESGHGSGWVFDTARGLIVTNAHVVDSGGPITVARDGREPQPAELVHVNVCEDLALLRVEDTQGLRELEIDERPQVGEELLVVGFPDSISEEPGLQVKEGIISRRGVTFTSQDRNTIATYRDLIQVDGAVIPGNSGGPLIAEDDGRLLGVNTLSEDVRGRETVGYAIAPRRVSQVLENLPDFSVPGMTLDFGDGSSPPEVVAVTSTTLRDGGVRPQAGEDARQQLIAMNGREFGSDLPANAGTLCSELPEVGDDRETFVTYKFRDTDGEVFRVRVPY